MNHNTLQLKKRAKKALFMGGAYTLISIVLQLVNVGHVEAGRTLVIASCYTAGYLTVDLIFEMTLGRWKDRRIAATIIASDHVTNLTNTVVKAMKDILPSNTHHYTIKVKKQYFRLPFSSQRHKLKRAYILFHDGLYSPFIVVHDYVKRDMGMDRIVDNVSEIPIPKEIIAPEIGIEMNRIEDEPTRKMFMKFFSSEFTKEELEELAKDARGVSVAEKTGIL